MTSAHRPRKGRRTAGFSLIELLVSMAIGLILTLAVTSVLIRSEGGKRSSTSVNDINQSGAYAAYVLDRAIRGAGSGFSQSWSVGYGCRLNVLQGSSPVLPIPSGSVAAASAFVNPLTGGAGMPALPLGLAPIIIAKNYALGTGGDVLIVMSGAAGVGEAGLPVSPAPIPVGATSIPVPNALGLGTDDLLLLADPSVTSGSIHSCLMEQVGTRTRTASSTTLPLAGTYYTGGVSGAALTSFGGNTTAIQLGNAGASTLNMPQFQLFGVGPNRTLMSYDLLQVPVSASTPNDTALADGVVQMRAIYGLDTTSPPDGVIDSWIDATGSDPANDYSAATLANGSPASQTKLRQIVAIRLGLILQTALAERPTDYQQPAGTTLTLFSDAVDRNGASLAQTRTLASGELNYRFRTIELTIPLRNTLLAP